MIIHLTKENFKDEISKNELIVVDFWASWCGPCRMLGPLLEQVEDEGLVRVGKVNVDTEDAISMAFNISSIPALLAFKEGRLVGKKIGFMPYSVLVEWIESLKK